MSHGVGPLFLTGFSKASTPTPTPTPTPEPVRPTDITPESAPTPVPTPTPTPTPTRGTTNSVSRNGLGLGNIVDSLVTGTITAEAVVSARDVRRLYWNYLDTDWANETQMTVAVFTTPKASVGGRSLNPLSEVDEAEFVTAEGAEYLEESGIRETAGLGPNPSWAVPPAEVNSRSMTFLGNRTTMRSYVGYVTTSGSEIPRTVLINLATTETGDDIAFGVTVQHRAMYSMSDNGAAPSTEAMSVPDLVGDEANSPTNYSAGDDITLIVEAGITTSADLAAQALGDLSLA